MNDYLKTISPRQKKFIKILNIAIVVLFAIPLLMGSISAYSWIVMTFLTMVMITLLVLTTVKPLKKKSKSREWTDALIFAVIAATFIRSFIVEAYTIPTSSMEKSLLVGDFLFVSKMHYGPRVPMTPLSFPFAHNNMPIFGSKSYIEAMELPYMRLPGFSTVERNDIVVFNYPLDKPAANDKYLRPVDKRENYIKRCIAIPGDELSIKDRQVYINGVAAGNPPEMQFSYQVTYKTPMNIPDKLREKAAIENKKRTSIKQKAVLKNVNKIIDDMREMKINFTEIHGGSGSPDYYFITEEQVEKLKQMSYVARVELFKQDVSSRPLFPGDSKNPSFSLDNYGPVPIPRKGQTVEINKKNIKIYQRVITT
ncbi:MAG: signal peptidase I [Bacteroidetes bacterium]|nr:signal peptidase I [Bacteroidota bacterium]